MAGVSLDNIVRGTAQEWCETQGVPMARYDLVEVAVKGILPPLIPLGADSEGLVKRALARAAPYETEAIVNVMQNGYLVLEAYGLALVPKRLD